MVLTFFYIIGFFSFNSNLVSEKKAAPATATVQGRHRILLRLARNVLLRSFKECNVFFEFFVTYETQKNVVYLCVLLKERAFFSKERAFFLKERIFFFYPKKLLIES